MAMHYDPQTALIVVDVQNDFAHPDGRLYVSGAEEALQAVNREVERARAAGAPILYTQDWHPPSTPHFAKDGGDWPVHCVQDSWGAELHQELIGDGPILRKGAGGQDAYSGFTMRDPESGDEDDTDLDRLLRERGARRVVVVGLAQDVCVKHTALDAVERGYETTVLLDATRPVDVEPGDGDRAVEELRKAGVAIS